MTTPQHEEAAAQGARDETALTSHGQRRVNLIWEVTQSVIALSVTITTLIASARLAIGDQAGDAAFLLLSNAFFLVIGFYFGRTNHTRTGGVAPWEGR